MSETGDLAAVVSSVTSTLALMLAEIRRRRKHAEHPPGVHEQLLQLERALHKWITAARVTDRVAKEYAACRPGLASEERIKAAAAVDSQGAAIFGITETFKQLAALPSRDDSPRTSDLVSLEDVLRVYAPQVMCRTSVLVSRARMIDTMSHELERHYQLGGVSAMGRYTAELERATKALDGFATELAKYIREEFPLTT